jgi:hypothetical protein
MKPFTKGAYMFCNTNLLDEFSDNEFGHADWKMDWDADGNCIVTFFKEARPEYLADLEWDEEDDVHPSFDPVFKNER